MGLVREALGKKRAAPRMGRQWLATITPRRQPGNLFYAQCGDLRRYTGGHRAIVLYANDISGTKLSGVGCIHNYPLPCIKIKDDQTVTFHTNDDGIHSHSYHPQFHMTEYVAQGRKGTKRFLIKRAGEEAATAALCPQTSKKRRMPSAYAAFWLVTFFAASKTPCGNVP